MKMSTLFSWSNWLRLLGRKPAPAKTPTKTVKRAVTRKRQPDFADYGTAFGLDMSLSNQQPAAQEASQMAATKKAGKKKRGKAAAQEAATPAS
jgi:hypothetical protein